MSKILKRSILSGSILLAIVLLLPYLMGVSFNRNHPPAQQTTSLTTLLEHMESKQINWKEDGGSFAEGVYYEYTGGTSADEEASMRQIKHPELILGYVSARGVDLREAWYKSYASSCSPPGSDQAMDVIVPAKLIIKVTSPIAESQAAELGLQRQSSPSMGTCAYRIRHYAFGN